MKYTIKKGAHRAWPWSLGLWFNKQVLRRAVYFDNSCKYHLEGEDMDDTNKLFGIGYFPNHHKDSARFGWRYNPDTEKIRVSAYCFVNGKRIILDLCEVAVFRWYHFTLTVLDSRYQFEIRDGFNDWHVIGDDIVIKTHNKNWSYRLGLFFGGNKPAPQKMHIEIKKT